jgi:hypothetical protein
MSGEREGQGVYSMLVTAAVFHPDTSPLNDDAPSNMPLKQGRQACAGDAAAQHRPGRPRDQQGQNKKHEGRLGIRKGDKERQRSGGGASHGM